MIDFVAFPKIPRLFRPITVTEKIDGTNASIYVPESVSEPLLFASRTRWITPADDNHGFARWATEHAEELRKLGPGHHFREWMGLGINRNYGLKEKRFALFNAGRWTGLAPACCSVVPILYQGVFSQDMLQVVLDDLRTNGSHAVPGFMKPEGVVVFHCAGYHTYKITLESDEAPKGSH